jgi:hypothetical protein
MDKGVPHARARRRRRPDRAWRGEARRGEARQAGRRAGVVWLCYRVRQPSDSVSSSAE